MTTFPEDQVLELKHFGVVSAGTEGGQPFYRFDELTLPESCSPRVSRALLCPTPRDGYNFRLFFSSQIQGPVARNWNGQNVRILEENWYAFSLTVPTGLRLAQMVGVVVRALAV